MMGSGRGPGGSFPPFLGRVWAARERRMSQSDPSKTRITASIMEGDIFSLKRRSFYICNDGLFLMPLKISMKGLFV